MNVKYITQQLKADIEREFICVLRYNEIRPEEQKIMRGDEYVFVYNGLSATKRTIRLKFDVFNMPKNDKSAVKPIARLYLSISKTKKRKITVGE